MSAITQQTRATASKRGDGASVLQVLGGERAIVSTEGLVRIRHNGVVTDELVPRAEAENLVEFFADWRPRYVVDFVEYEAD